MADDDHEHDGTSVPERSPEYLAFRAEGRRRLERVAGLMTQRFDGLDVAGDFAAIAVTLLVATLGEANAASYLRQLAAGIEAEPSDPARGCAGRA